MNTPNKNRKPLKAVVGAAHHALRAYVKAYTLAADDAQTFRYQVRQDGKHASIVAADGRIVVERPIENWAAEGPAIRRALIALKWIKESIENVQRSAPDEHGEHQVRYFLNVLDNRAGLTLDGKPLAAPELLPLLPKLNLADGANKALAALASGNGEDIAGWSQVGRELEVDFFLILQTAERYGLSEAAAAEVKRGYKLGIIRPPRQPRQSAEALANS